MRAIVCVVVALGIPGTAIAQTCTRYPEPDRVVEQWRAGHDVACLHGITRDDHALTLKVATRLGEASTDDLLAALVLVDTNAPQSAEARSVRYQLARKAVERDRAEQALKSLERNVNESADAVASAALLARATARTGGQPGTICRNLARSGRYAQALACLEGGGPAVDGDVRLEVLQAQTSLTVAGLEVSLPAMSTERANAALALARRCNTGKPALEIQAYELRLRDAPIPSGTARLFALLADNAPDAAAQRCHLIVSALGCLADIDAGRDCNALDSMARLVTYLYLTKSRDEANVYLTAMFSEKSRFYDRLRSNPSYRSALFQMHVGLANVYRHLEERDPFGHDWKWHAARAQEFWQQVNGKKPLPEGLLPTP